MLAETSVQEHGAVCSCPEAPVDERKPPHHLRARGEPGKGDASPPRGGGGGSPAPIPRAVEAMRVVTEAGMELAEQHRKRCHRFRARPARELLSPPVRPEDCP